MLSGISLYLLRPGGDGKVKFSHLSLYFVHLEVEVDGLGVSAPGRVSNPKLLSLSNWYSESTDNVDGERDLSLFKEGITSGDERF